MSNFTFDVKGIRLQIKKGDVKLRRGERGNDSKFTRNLGLISGALSHLETLTL